MLYFGKPSLIQIVFALLTIFTAVSKSAIIPNKATANRIISVKFDVKHTKSPENITFSNNEHSKGNVPVPLKNAKVEYLASLYLGSTKQVSQVVLDTGSSDLWVANSEMGGPYNASESSTYHDTGYEFSDAYGSGSASGTWAYEEVSLYPDGKAITGVKFGNVNKTVTMPFEGILGIGLEGLEGTAWNLLFPYATGERYPNFPSLLVEQGFIDKRAYSLFLNSENATTGTIIFGGIDHAKYDGSLVELPLSGKFNERADQNRLDVTLNDISFNGSNYSVKAPVNLDSGTTHTILPEDVYNKFVEYFQDSCDQSDNFVSFNFDGVSIKVPYSDIVDTEDNGCSLLIDKGTNEFILGGNFLRHSYAVYDLDNRTISLAQVKYTNESDVETI